MLSRLKSIFNPEPGNAAQYNSFDFKTGKWSGPTAISGSDYSTEEFKKEAQFSLPVRAVA